VRVIEEVWSKGWRLRYWLAPLERTCEELFEAGFLIGRLLEPRPAPTAAEIDFEDINACPKSREASWPCGRCHAAGPGRERSADVATSRPVRSSGVPQLHRFAGRSSGSAPGGPGVR
jgi:hypothetical protein